jgi:hypothetical protein
MLFQSIPAWMFILLPMVAVMGALGLRRHRDHIIRDVAYARRLGASRVARKRLAHARQLASGDDARAFFAEVARALRGFVADKLNVPEAGMQMYHLEAGLRRGGAPAPLVDEVVERLESCDRQRFAPGTSGREQRTAFLQNAEDLMTALDREMR